MQQHNSVRSWYRYLLTLQVINVYFWSLTTKNECLTERWSASAKLTLNENPQV